MVAYLIVEHTITDPAKFEEYGAQVGPMIAAWWSLSDQKRDPTAARDRPASARSSCHH